MGMMIEQSRQEPPTNGEVIDRLCKEAANKETIKIIKKNRISSSRDLPSKSFYKNTLESYPSYHHWKTTFLNFDRSSLYLYYHNIETNLFFFLLLI